MGVRVGDADTRRPGRNWGIDCKPPAIVGQGGVFDRDRRCSVATGCWVIVDPIICIMGGDGAPDENSWGV